MLNKILFQSRARALVCALFSLPLALSLHAQEQGHAQEPKCVAPTDQKLTIYHAGSVSAAFKPLEAALTCQTGVQVKDVFGSSVGMARQCVSETPICDLYASADYMDVDLFLKPTGYADFNIVFAKGRMVLGYSAKDIAAKNLAIVDPKSGPFDPPNSIPKASADWYKILTSPGVAIGGSLPFMDPGAYRSFLIFQLAQEYYKQPLLYDKFMSHVVVSGPNADHSVPALGKLYDFQLTYEHGARATAKKDPDFRYVDLPDAVNLSDPAKNAEYSKNAVVVLPGLETPGSVQSVPVRAVSVAWGITLLKNAPDRENAVKFLQLLLGPAGNAALNEFGPTPIFPAHVSPEDFPKLPESLRPLVKKVRE
jgi:molybdate/tungstate transport system substrate-binding protein